MNAEQLINRICEYDITVQRFRGLVALAKHHGALASSLGDISQRTLRDASGIISCDFVWRYNDSRMSTFVHDVMDKYPSLNVKRLDLPSNTVRVATYSLESY